MIATSPAAFNPDYEKGVIIDMDQDLHLTFMIAMNVKGGKASFLTMELWSDDGHIGTTAGSLDLASGDLRYESRLERMDCPTQGSCGFNRHTRVHASLKMQGQQPSGLNDISFAYSNIQAPPGQMGYGGVLVTAKGDLSQGVKARLWQATSAPNTPPAARADFDVPANWVEVGNSACFTSSTDSALSCGSGLERFQQNTAFLLNGSQTPVVSWFQAAAPASFQAVDLDQDTQQ